jgi:outer membrane receptor protein involved in Fe transport
MTFGLLELTVVAVQSSVTQPSLKSSHTVEDIIVTGERVPRRLRDTASSVAVITEREIDAAAADRVEQILALIPNVQLGSGSDGPAVRGQDTTGVLHDLPAFLGGNRPRMTLQIDGRAVSYNEFAYGAGPLWDVERIEVFRSPQTTTQGRNSIAGSIFIETQAPSWNWKAGGRAIAGNYDTRQISGVISGPLLKDQVAIRVAGDLRHARGISELGRNANGGPDPNDDDYGQVRVKLLARPAVMPNSTMELVLAHIETNAPQIAGVRAPFKERRDPDAAYGIFTTNVDSATARLKYSASESLHIEATASGGDARVRRFAPIGFGETRIHSRDLSGEVIARWQSRAAFDLIGGVSALRTKLDQRIDVSGTPFGIGVFGDIQKSRGVFGQASIDLTASLRLTGGLRYQWDRQDRDGGLDGRRGEIPIHFHESFDAWLPKASLEYRATPDLNVGLLIQRAYNPGGTTIDLQARELDTFKAETLWDMELFARATLPESGVSIAANLFYYAMQDAQRPQEREIEVPGGPGPVTFLEIDNAPRARTYGAEVELRWQATDRLRVQAGIGLLSTKVTSTIDPSDPMLGKSFQRAPAFTGAVGVDWRPVWNARLSAQLRHNSDYFSDDIETGVLKVDGSTTANVRASWQFPRFEAFAYLRNVTDEFHLVYRGDVDFGVAADPRQFGVGIEAKF